MKRLVGLIVMVATIGLGAGTASAEKPVVCVWPYVGTSSGVCVYMPAANPQ